MSIISEIINELARNRGYIEGKVSDMAEVIMHHLVEIYLWRDTIYKNHWCTELYGFLHSIQKYSHNHKFPKSSEIYNWLWTDNGVKLNKIIEGIIDGVKDGDDDYKDLQEPKNVNNKDIEKFVIDYIVWLSTELSKGGIVSKNEIKSKVNDLLKKHPYELQE